MDRVNKGRRILVEKERGIEEGATRNYPRYPHAHILHLLEAWLRFLERRETFWNLVERGVGGGGGGYPQTKTSAVFTCGT